ncbi:hypothetical protein [Gorillibacterium massiliense]|uniref:hypothetical protein n=1 Tax=Gorillibacterium massiliense TaxID=1280390 RepID=UPI0004B80D6B|nr:hypothetical protein [Gorillibacterium massiliense]
MIAIFVAYFILTAFQLNHLWRKNRKPKTYVKVIGLTLFCMSLTLFVYSMRENHKILTFLENTISPIQGMLIPADKEN